MSQVRIGTPEDLPQLLELAKAAHAEQGEHPLNLEKVAAIMARGLMLQGGIVGVIGPTESLEGMVILLADPVWYSDDLQLLELSTFVREDCRRSTYAKDLIAFAKRCARELKLDLSIGVYSNIRTEAKVRLYERQVKKVGAFFRYRAGEDDAPAAAPSAVDPPAAA